MNKGDNHPIKSERKIVTLMLQSRSARINAIMAIAAVVLIVILSMTIPHFMKVRNILNILEQLSILGFIAIGMTYVMVCGGIDLSMHTVVSAACVVGASVMVKGISPIFGCFLMVLVGMGATGWMKHCKNG